MRDQPALDLVRLRGPRQALHHRIPERRVVEAVAEPLAAAALTSHLYCGEDCDSTGLIYLRDRYYNPLTASFTTRDSYPGNTSDPQSLHKYVFCNGDGINGIDPSGQFALFWLLGPLTEQLELRLKDAAASLGALCNAYALQRAVGIYQTAVRAYAEIGFQAAGLLVRAGSTIRTVTTLAGLTFVASTVELVCEEARFWPRTGYNKFVAAASATLFNGGLALGEISNELRRIIDPLRGSQNGSLLSGTQANALAAKVNPTYSNSFRPYAFAARGRIAPGTDLVRVHTAYNKDQPFVMLRSGIIGLTPERMKTKYSLPYVPEFVSDVAADTLDALSGLTSRILGGTGSAEQILLLQKGAVYSNTRPLGNGPFGG